MLVEVSVETVGLLSTSQYKVPYNRATPVKYWYRVFKCSRFQNCWISLSVLRCAQWGVNAAAAGRSQDNGGTGMLNPAFSIQHPASSIRHPASSIHHLAPPPNKDPPSERAPSPSIAAPMSSLIHFSFTASFVTFLITAAGNSSSNERALKCIYEANDGAKEHVNYRNTLITVSLGSGNGGVGLFVMFQSHIKVRRESP